MLLYALCVLSLAAVLGTGTVSEPQRGGELGLQPELHRQRGVCKYDGELEGTYGHPLGILRVTAAFSVSGGWSCFMPFGGLTKRGGSNSCIFFRYVRADAFDLSMRGWSCLLNFSVPLLPSRFQLCRHCSSKRAS